MRLAFSDLDAKDKNLIETLTKNWFLNDTSYLQVIQNSTEDIYKELKFHNIPTSEATLLPTSPRDRDISSLPEITSY